MTYKSLFQLVVVTALVLGASHVGQTQFAPTLPGANAFRYIVQLPSPSLQQVSSLSQWLVRNNFDVAGVDWRQGRVEVVTTTQGVDFLKNRGLSGYINQTSEQSRGPDARYLNPQRLEEKLRAIAQAYPQLTRLEAIGKTHQGRPIWALLLSDTPQPNNPKNLEKPSIIFDGLHHAREIMTPEIVVDVAETLLKAANFNRRVQTILHRWSIWLVPMMNPDGSNIVFTARSMWRKNARADGGNIHGVDLNRNYAFKWSACNGSSGSKSSDTYHGPAAASEPEVLAISKLAEAIRPTASLSYHSYSELVLTPYGCRGEYAGEKEMIARTARELAARLPTDSGSGNYTPGTPWEILYGVDGDSMDYFYGAFGAFSFTFEVNRDFQPPYSVREPTLRKHRVAWGYFLDRIDNNLLSLTVVDGRTGKPSEALIAVNTIVHNKGELPFKTNVAGRYFKVLDPGKYVISAKLGDGRVGTVEVQMAGQPRQEVLTIK